jgi:SAM-dependent methyltransferase
MRGTTVSSLDLDALEIGCGVGRMTRMMARIFRSVTAVDVSTEMVERAKTNLKGLDNVSVVLGDGATLSALAEVSFDFAFSFIVFQHIPAFEVVASYCREVYRVLRPGGLFKFQLQGAHWSRDEPPDTWYGLSFSEEESHLLCQDTGFILEHSAGAGTQVFWLWFRKSSEAAGASFSGPLASDQRALE